ncbi:hypothetical protein BC828DRAFT_391510 [Blastocladiella britannica]|nr:hypothetical protein BC828DRAFT_391510 [Blastocladiella britannica]
MSTDPSSSSSQTTDASSPSTWDVIKSINLDDMKNIGQVPCARNSLLYGMGSGFGAGVLRFAYQGRVLSASNYAVAAFCSVSIISWEVCRSQMKQRAAARVPTTVLPPSSSSSSDASSQQ